MRTQMAATLALNSMVLFLLLMMLAVVETEDKFCDSGGILPFSGFKIHRQYRINGPVPASFQFMIFSHCVHGKLDYQKIVQLESITDIDWTAPICILKAPKFSSKVKTGKYDKLDQIFLNISLSYNERRLETTTFAERLFTKAGEAKSFLKDKAGSFLERVTKNMPFKYTAETTKRIQDKIETADIEALLESGYHKVVCYKMARRKKYAKSDLSFYIPETFVGALYECPLTKEAKMSRINSFMAPSTTKLMDFTCDNDIARPILPLIADKVSKQWVDVNFNVLKPSMIHTMPYMTTASPLNLRFALTNTPGISTDTWASKIRVNEDYDYTKADFHLLTRAIAMTTDKVFKMIKPINFNSLLKTATLKSNYTIPSPIADSDFFINRIHDLPLPLKASFLLAFNITEYLPQLSLIQMLWDNTIDFT